MSKFIRINADRFVSNNLYTLSISSLENSANTNFADGHSSSAYLAMFGPRWQVSSMNPLQDYTYMGECFRVSFESNSGATSFGTAASLPKWPAMASDGTNAMIISGGSLLDPGLTLNLMDSTDLKSFYTNADSISWGDVVTPASMHTAASNGEYVIVGGFYDGFNERKSFKNSSYAVSQGSYSAQSAIMLTCASSGTQAMFAGTLRNDVGSQPATELFNFNSLGNAISHSPIRENHNSCHGSSNGTYALFSGGLIGVNGTPTKVSDKLAFTSGATYTAWGLLSITNDNTATQACSNGHYQMLNNEYGDRGTILKSFDHDSNSISWSPMSGISGDYGHSFGAASGYDNGFFSNSSSLADGHSTSAAYMMVAGKANITTMQDGSNEIELMSFNENANSVFHGNLRISEWGTYALAMASNGYNCMFFGGGIGDNTSLNSWTNISERLNDAPQESMNRSSHHVRLKSFYTLADAIEFDMLATGRGRRKSVAASDGLKAFVVGGSSGNPLALPADDPITRETDMRSFYTNESIFAHTTLSHVGTEGAAVGSDADKALITGGAYADLTNSSTDMWVEAIQFNSTSKNSAFGTLRKFFNAAWGSNKDKFLIIGGAYDVFAAPIFDIVSISFASGGSAAVHVTLTEVEQYRVGASNGEHIVWGGGQRDADYSTQSLLDSTSRVGFQDNSLIINWGNLSEPMFRHMASSGYKSAGFTS
jgi:hypothetical protein